MSNTRTTEAFRLYYESVLKDVHNNPELLAHWGKDPARLETQINCHKTGVPIPDTKKFEEDGEVWGPVRWPYNADSDPNYSDPPISFMISKRMKAIGSTGWNWKEKKSEYIGFDFDSILDHPSEKIGISEKELAKIDNIDVPWLEVVRSTQGNGRHIYIRFQEPYPVAANHNEHAAIARAFLPLIAKATGLDMEGNVDCFGMILWFQHANATKENRGYEMVKPATQILTAEHVPPNWRDHIEVTSGSRSKVRVKGWGSEGETEGDELDEMTQAHAKVELDEVHLKILDDLEGTGHSSLWVHDHHLWQGHTAGLKEVFDNWEAKGTPMRGLFDTDSFGDDPGKPNCFMRPKINGGWDVYRFGTNTGECALWSPQGKWTHTTYNFPPTLKQIAMACGGYEGPDMKQGYLFSSQEEVAECLRLLKVTLDFPTIARDRTYSIRAREDGKLILSISKERSDRPADFPRYAKTAKGWEMVLQDTIDTSDKEQDEDELWSELDEKFRALKITGIDTKGGEFASWVMRDASTGWTGQPRENIKSYLVSCGYKQCDPILGGAIFRSWSIVCEPFQVEYPGGRVWNRNSAQFKYEPVELLNGEAPYHPHWDKVMDHCGVDLDNYIPNLPWCREWGITNGGDYLTAWIACMLQNPYCKLPYLFMYGPQNSGKSIFHEAIRLLMTDGVVSADRALTSSQGYNGELRDAVLGVVDEVDISKAGLQAYNKLKDWTMGLTISIHAKYKQVEDRLSTLHFVQMANTRSSLPVFPGDTRITAFHVPSLEEEIPKDRLLDLLRKEAPHFMRTIMDMDIPEATERIALPVIETQGKTDAVASNLNPLQQFISEKCHAIAGAAIAYNEFREKFLASLEEFQKSEWPDAQIKREVSETFPIGRRRANISVIGNISFTQVEPTSPLIKDGQRLIRRDEV